ncbi:hypothetical protein J3A64_004830 [Pseudarthrobacter sp. PvP004]|uniref:right-handed parallel beta-helix repeat-containing protein n=1 Tax=Pseudarthrobacter sp. PvP004 TaxID=2817850 RepID=UPI001AE68699|nr:right-handed parallel beta-helix repeat-containing protein [Pseudarthrobacter sp. PvP004]MBP2269290.1 hypothetical protein [Pseudarthrobacter sp. PvP004]
MRNLTKAMVLAVGLVMVGAPMASASLPAAPSATPSGVPAGVPAGTDGDTDLTPQVTDGSNYSGDPTSEAALVVSEDQRLVMVRTQAAIARWTGASLNVPYRVASGTGYTLVLTARAKDYTLDDLLSLAPKTFVRQPDGSYLLSENIVIESGATLTLSRPTPLTIKMFSSAQKFVSIVNYGGRVNVVGSPTAPVTVTSWDTDHSSPRGITDNGRAYIRSIGGTVVIDHASFESLGFWSGRTGGLSMTGSDRPITGAITGTGAAVIKHHSKNSKHPQVTDAAPAEPVPGAVLPSDIVPSLEENSTQTDFSYVTASVTNTQITDNVYGLFLANAIGVSVHNVTAEKSRMDGFVLHRNVSNATIVDSTAKHSALDGFRLSRSIRSVRLDTDISEFNGRNGIYIDGRPLATGPSATGTSISSYGNDVVVINSTMTGNSHYGLEIRGGRSTTVRSNTISDSVMGIVAQDAASGVTVDDNRLDGLAMHAIALRDGVTGGKVTNNTVSDSVVGVYLRDAAADVESNNLTGISNHGISALGAATITVRSNIISGSGPSAVDLKRAENATSSNNTTAEWTFTKSFWQMLASFFQPLTILWTVLALILVFTALRGRRLKRTIRHPYADQAPMSAFTDLDPMQIRPDSLGPADTVPPAEQPRTVPRRRAAQDAHADGGSFRPAERGHVEAGLT